MGNRSGERGMERRRTRLRRILWGWVLIALLGGLFPPAAWAHAYLVKASPAPDSVVAAPPSHIQLWFSEPLESRFASVTVLDPGGKRVATGPPAADPRDGSSLVVPLEGTSERGTYTVHWRVVSADGHPVEGNFVFSVGTVSAAPAGGAETAGGPPPLGVVARGLQWAALLTLPGLIGFWRVLARRKGEIPAPPAEAVRRVTAWTATAVLAASLLRLPVETHIQGELPFWGEAWSPAQWAVLIGNSSFGAVFVEQIPLLFLLVLAAWRRDAGERWLRPGPGGDLWLFPAFGVLLPMALAGHARTSVTPAFDVPVDMLHLGAAGWWIGGLAGMAVWWRATGAAGREWYAAVRAVGWGFAGSLTILVLTGMREGVLHAPTAFSLTHTVWGKALLVKLMLVAGMAILAAWHGLPLSGLPREGRAAEWRGRTLVAEWALGMLVTICVAVLTSSAPAQSNPGPLHLVLAEKAGIAEVWVEPNRAGVNHLRLELRDPSGRPLADLETVRVTVSMPSMPEMGETEVALRPVGPGRYEAGGSFLSMGGRWQIRIHGLTRSLEDIDWNTEFSVGR
ncbi:copper homeostasis periplasmic binding protein CopC [Kyrpidia tusciae]|uniref:Copper resistance protein CopC n=1 Tax=Kyrpidia tusciae (strain DSM 2912 / NBRC 15312 / T2) TaxID=562970 RepID=D5WT21_KYRT2|nr:copper homeostasis periplasmic binding protein CopC [Kyrpidia tusciae]ADG05125.1 copper resistance protein CopC [Kyrpidia tusciae DSM 2912]